MSAKFTYLTDLASAIESNSDLKSQVASDPVTTLKNLQGPIPIPDTGVYRILIIILGLAVLLPVCGSLAIAAFGKGGSVPEGVIAIASAAIGALAGILVPSPAQRNN